MALLLCIASTVVRVSLHLLPLGLGLFALGLEVVGDGPHGLASDAEEGGESGPEESEDVLAAVVLAGSLAVLVEPDVGDVVAGGEEEADGEGDELKDEVLQVLHVCVLDGGNMGVDEVESAVAEVIDLDNVGCNEAVRSLKDWQNRSDEVDVDGVADID